jgi:hypothetical protein
MNDDMNIDYGDENDDEESEIRDIDDIEESDYLDIRSPDPIAPRNTQQGIVA